MKTDPFLNLLAALISKGELTEDEAKALMTLSNGTWKIKMDVSTPRPQISLWQRFGAKRDQLKREVVD